METPAPKSRGRPPLPPGQKKENFNAKMDPEVLAKLSLVAFRKSVRACKEITMTSIIVNEIAIMKVPKAPTAKQLEAYYLKYPKLRP